MKKNEVRPTTAKIIKSLFDILQNYDFNTNTFLDLFCGTCRVGIEAFKKGFQVTAVEKNYQQFLKVKKVIKSKNYTIDIIKKDAVNFLKEVDKKFDCIFIDPPYNNVELYVKCLEVIFNKKIIEKNGVIILEKSVRLPLQIDFHKYNSKHYTYGDTELIVVRNT